MEWTNPSGLPPMLLGEWANQPLKVTYTQWEDDDLEADEATTEWEAILVDCTVTENRLQGMDGGFTFQTPDGEESFEVMMDFPSDGEDVIAVREGNLLKILGNEATLFLHKK
ncbi:hypothetical protein [Ammoniphilus sp. 3BR4]|uniref:hypothetical protein n=1 Tax=Ammoniphilus sp. 3BR4 TaxID=3158265 RepID=UPI003466FC01